MVFADRFRSALRLLLAFGCVFAARAEEGGATVGGTAAAIANSGITTLSGGGGISILGYVLTILVLAVAAAGVLFKGGFMAFKGASKAERKLHIEESRSLGHRQYLVVAEYDGRRFLLGVCPGSIEYLSGLDSEGTAPAGSFQELLPKDPKADTPDSVPAKGAQ